MSEWLVDGNNVMGARPDGWWRDRPGAMRRLVAELERFADARDVPVTVIFDGAAFDVGGGIRVGVGFASRRGPDAADDNLAALVARHSEPTTLTVVTSDARLAERVRSRGAEVMGSGAFLRRMPSGDGPGEGHGG